MNKNFILKSRDIYKSKAICLGFIFVFSFIHFSVFSQTKFDPVKIQNENLDEDYVLLDYKVDIKFDYDKNENLITKTRHRKEYFVIGENPYLLSNFHLLFGSTQKVKINSARYYDVDSLGKISLFDNVKTKFLKERDYYINGIFYNDIKSKNIQTKTETGEWTYIVLDYEYVDTDLKFINTIFPNPTGEKVIKFTLSVDKPSYVDFDVVTYNIEESNLNSTTSDTECTYTMNNIKPVKFGNFPPPYTYVAPHFVPVVRKIKDNNYLASPDDLFKWYNSLISELEGNDKFIDDITQQIIKNKTTDEEKIQAIYKFAQNNINYIAFEDGIAGFKPDECDNVLTNGYGDCKGYANVLTNLLQAAGIESGHAWIGTRRIPYNYDLAALCVDNHMVCWVKHNDELFILDGTGQDYDWRKIPSHLQGKETLLKVGNEYEIVKLPVRKSNSNLINLEAIVNIENNNPVDIFEGSLTIKGNEALSLIYAFNESSVITKKQFAVRVFQSYFGYHFSDFEISKVEMSLDNEIIEINFKVNVFGNMIKSGKLLYLFSSIDDNYLSIDYPNREFYYDNLVNFKSKISFNYPSNYTISTLPKNVNFSNELFTVKSEIKSQTNSLLWEKNIEVKKLYSGEDDIQDRKEYQSNYFKIFQNPIVLNIK